MPGSGTETRRMDRQVLVRLPEQLATAVAAAAETDGLTAAAWLRQRAVDATGADPAHARPSAPVLEPAADVAELGRLIRTLGMTTGAVVQLARAVRETGTAGHAEVEAVLAKLRGVQGELVDTLEDIRACRRHKG